MLLSGIADVACDLLCLVGTGGDRTARRPVDAVAFSFDLSSGHFRWQADPSPVDVNDGDITILVTRAAVVRTFGAEPAMTVGRAYHLPPHLRVVALAIRDTALADPARETYRRAKCVELLCETMALQLSDSLVPSTVGSWLSQADRARLVEARRLIEDRWSEKLTLDLIARACGLNRAKLTRGFRDLFECTVADALAERRLSQAGRMLLVTDLPVSSIGYQCGYTNNASFARAFTRHFGLAPTVYRAARLAA